MRREGAGPGDDPERARYRRLANLLAARVEEPPPDDLAARTVAALAHEQALTARFERNLLLAMLGVLALAVLACAFLYGAQWRAELGPELGLLRSPWLFALLGGWVLSQALGAWFAPRRVRPLGFALAST